jgi:hypothetical protein
MMPRPPRPLSARHLRPDELEALRDGEGALPWRMWAQLHLGWCASCRAARNQLEAEWARTSALLGLDTVTTDAEAGWARLARVADRPPRRAWMPRMAVLAAAAAVVAAIVLVDRSFGADLVARMYHLSTQSRLAPKQASVHDRVFAQSLATLERRGALQRVSDVCCADRDGEGPADDGVLTVRLDGSRWPVVILYEDTRHAGRFEPGDVILIVSRPGV